MSNREWFEIWMITIAVALLIHGAAVVNLMEAAIGIAFAATAAVSIQVRLRKGQTK